MLTDALQRIRAFAEHKGWRPARFAREAGLHANTLRDFHSPDWSPRLETIRKLEAIIPPDFNEAA